MIAHQQCKLDAIPNREYSHTASTHKLNCVYRMYHSRSWHWWLGRSMIECLTCMRSFIVSFNSLNVFSRQSEWGILIMAYFFPSLFLHTFKLCAAALCHAMPLLLFCMGIWYIARALINHDYCFCCWPFNLIITIRFNVIKKKYYSVLCSLLLWYKIRFVDFCCFCRGSDYVAHALVQSKKKELNRILLEFL